VEARATSLAFVKAAQSRVDIAFAAATCPPPAAGGQRNVWARVAGRLTRFV
jgi:hypothetical protein